MNRDWIPLCLIAGFYLLAGAVAPPIEALIGCGRESPSDPVAQEPRRVDRCSTGPRYYPTMGRTYGLRKRLLYITVSSEVRPARVSEVTR
jgi:hypothetical protein